MKRSLVPGERGSGASPAASGPTPLHSNASTRR
jgi:hypothetical protein